MVCRFRREMNDPDGDSARDQHGYQITFRKKVYQSIEELQADPDEWIDFYNTPIGDCHAITCRAVERTHQGKMCCGRTPFQTMIEGKQIWKEKFVN